MTRSSALVERPVLRLLLLALMGLALASRLALGATLPATAEDGAAARAPLAQLQAAMIVCHAGHGPKPSPALPHGPLLSDLLLFDQGDNTHALASNPIAVLPPASLGSAVEFAAVYAAGRPYLWRAAKPGRGPPAKV
jgi:hypothetical protein